MKLFNGENSVGKKVELEGQEFTISGVLKPWELRPRFYHPTEGQAFNRTEDLFMPLETVIDLSLYPHARAASTERVDVLSESREKNMFYLQAWIEFDNANQVNDFQTYLDGYSQSLKDAGEHPNDIINELNDVQTWLEKQELVDDQIIALLVASILFLVVCIFNASSLLLSRFHAAKFEIGLRRAIGANKGHLLQQSLVESVLLGLCSGLLALVLAWSFLKVSISFLPHLENLVAFEANILVGGLLLAIFTTTLSAALPYVPHEPLHHKCRVKRLRSRKMNIKALIKSLLLRKFNTFLLILQLAITLGLIVNSTILSLDTADKLSVDTGLNLDDTLSIEFRKTSGDYRDLDFTRSILQQDLAELAKIPGVNAITASNQLPIIDGGTNSNVYDVDDPESNKRDKSLSHVSYFVATQSIGDALSLELVEGRMLTNADSPSEEEGSVVGVLITESLSKALHNGDSSIGQELNSGVVVGVIKDIFVKPGNPKNKQYAVIINSVEQRAYWADVYILNIEPGMFDSVKSQVADVMLGVEPQRDIYRIASLNERFENYYSDNKGLSKLFIMLTLLMLLVTAISSFAYARFHMSQQTKFIGIRRALGAKKRDVILYVLAENWLLTLLGVLFGIVLMIGLNILLSQYVNLTKPNVLLTLLGMTVVLIAGTVATWWPAYQTSKIAPVIATRSI